MESSHIMNGLNLDLKGQKVLVTGASAGLGTYLCESFSAAGQTSESITMTAQKMQLSSNESSEKKGKLILSKPT